MKKYSLKILLCIAFLLWFVPYEGKDMFPSVFENNYIQWVTAALTSLLIPLGSLWALSWVRKKGQQKKDGYWILIGFSFPLVYCIFAYGLLQPMMTYARDNVLSIYATDAVMIRKLTTNVHEAKQQKQREDAARGLYIIFGIKALVPSVNGEFKMYSPNKKDEKEWQETQKMQETNNQTINMLNWQFKQIPWLFSLYLGNYIIIMAIGLGIYSYKKETEGTNIEIG